MAKHLTPLALALATALLAGACAATKPEPPGHVRLPTEQWTGQVGLEEAPRTLRLAVHPDGLSENQAKTLATFAANWAAEEGGEVQVIVPRAGGARFGDQAAGYLRQAGVSRLTLVSVDAPPGTPVEIGYLAFEASVPQCGQHISSYTATASNRVDPNFGCAITANKALMAASPQDLVRPRQADPVGAARAVDALARGLQAPAAAASGAGATPASGGTN